MSLQLSNEQVWSELEKELFAVLGMVTAKGEARTIGIVYVAQDQKIFIATERDTWKVRHIRQNPHVSITVTIPKRIPFIPWINIPSATISFSGMGIVLEPDEVGEQVLHALLRGLETDSE
ncbi:MAG: pyridoxamine 5'-phosphate oxidase family protein, partial [Candidatus Deferrimicrobiaceae bacterium]